MLVSDYRFGCFFPKAIFMYVTKISRVFRFYDICLFFFLGVFIMHYSAVVFKRDILLCKQCTQVFKSLILRAGKVLLFKTRTLWDFYVLLPLLWRVPISWVKIEVGSKEVHSVSPLHPAVTLLDIFHFRSHIWWRRSLEIALKSQQSEMFQITIR